MPVSSLQVHQVDSYRFVEEGVSSGLPPVVLLHGMLGDLSNWTETVQFLVSRYFHVFVPVLPVYDLPLNQTNVTGLVRYVQGFFETVNLHSAVLIGNSLGGHVALLFALQYPELVPAMVLSGASGIYEVNIGSSVPRRKDRQFVRERTAVTFYDPVHATDELVDEMFGILGDRSRVLRLIQMARATRAEKVAERLSSIHTPTLLVWGRDDVITPPDVAHAFKNQLPDARLRFIDRCGHAPMIEHPDVFNQLTLEFLYETIGRPVNSHSIPA